MSELRWNWVYFPYLDAPNKQEESALKAGYIKVVSKDEADKVIFDLEESHKMEVEQLLIKIVEMKKACKSKDDWCLHTLKRERHHKYKRCLAMARWCHNESLWWYGKGYGFEKYDKFWEKWEKRWLEIAEQFKESK